MKKQFLELDAKLINITRIEYVERIQRNNNPAHLEIHFSEDYHLSGGHVVYVWDPDEVDRVWDLLRDFTA